MLSILNKPLRVWHALAVLGVVLALGVTGTAIAVQGKLNAISTRATYTAGDFKYVVTAPQLNAASQQNNAVANCPHRFHVLGGGVANSGGFDEQHVNDSHPIDGTDPKSVPDDGWLVHLDNLANTDKQFAVFAVCAK